MKYKSTIVVNCNPLDGFAPLGVTSWMPPNLQPGSDRQAFIAQDPVAHSRLADLINAGHLDAICGPRDGWFIAEDQLSVTGIYHFNTIEGAEIWVAGMQADAAAGIETGAVTITPIEVVADL